MMTHMDRIGPYNVLAVLGYGASSTIYAVQQPRDGQVYALKRVIRKDPSDKRFIQQTINESRMAMRVDHPAIRKCFKLRRLGLVGTREVQLLMELVDGRNLVQQRPVTMLEQVKVFMTVAEGLAAMHKVQVVHADIKPNNILVTDTGEVKVIDLGQSCPVGTVKQRIQGTPDYIAPEQVKRRQLTSRTDIFNLGATMYWCVTDNHVPTLIPKSAHEVTLKQDMELREPNEINDKVTSALNSLILQCLKYRPEDRPESMNEIHARLNVAVHQLERDS